MPRILAHKASLRAVLAAALTALATTAAPPAAIAAAPTSPGPWPGTITLAVDATDLDRQIQRVTQTLPVPGPGPLTLHYPRFLPGTHGPYGDVAQLAGLQISAGERRIEWRRDTLDPYAFLIDVPAGVRELTLRYEHLAPQNSSQGRPTMTRQILGVQWNQTLLYPTRVPAAAVRVQAQVKLPEGWQAATALRDAQGRVAQADGQGWVRFAPVSVETLVDSPLFAGRHAKRVELDPPGTPRPVALNLLADEPGLLDASDAQLEAHRRLVQQSDRLFGARHWRQYDFLLAQSKHFGGIGLEHHESSENGVRPGYFKDWDKAIAARELLPHEYVHSWNGKFRRPADLLTPHYNVPMQNSLLWVYEGMTQYWGHVLTARSGLATPEQSRDALAYVAAYLDARAGRTWRNLQDTTNEGTIRSSRDKAWRDWQRSVDYYDEATLIWLDADTLIREKSGGAKSLDDFAKAFFGVPTGFRPDGSIAPLPYTFDEVVAALNAVQPHDWAGFLRQRLDSHGPGAPLDGLARGGWTLGWSSTESPFAKNAPSRDGKPRPADFRWSLGLMVTHEGKLEQVAWDSPAFKAGLAPGLTLLAVNLQAYTSERLAQAIDANRDGRAPIQLLLKEDDLYRLVTIDWRGGQRFPVLQRADGQPDRLSAIYSAR
ncbi:M61 family metallopeptidase [Ideonella alba]|uniref:M61 family metallopeptidase n=1 Tax=Ideonella alba TaxID=2824118 RepID=A0A940Y6A9_9BURK|nr:M61 family metallopeptidase [Ideonella alba]MBQ0929080.1 M61 family metallopeptidase [Ideonella alba]